MGAESNPLCPQISIPREFSQIRDAIGSIRKVRSLHENLVGLQEVAIIGFDMFAPEVVTQSDILTNPQRRVLVRRSVRYLMALNERLDLSYAGRRDATQVVQQSIANEELEYTKFLETTNFFPQERDRLQDLVRSATVEIEGIEEAIRARRDMLAPYDLYLQDVATYKELSNAINTCFVTQMLFGSKHLEARLQVLPENFSILTGKEKWDFLQERYAWLTNIGRTSSPQNNFEKALGISWLLAMAGQVEDDRSDPTDRLLQIPSFGTTRESTDKALDAKISEYENRAMHLGLSFTANAFIHTLDTFVQNEKKDWMRRLAAYGFLDSIPIPKAYSLRERWFINLYRDERRLRREKRKA